MTIMGPERGFPPPARSRFDWEAGPDGALFVGSPQTVARKIAASLPLLGATRFDLKYGMPGMTHDQNMASIELFGTQVVPRVRELLR
jgi:alkanesulfonate monooxygenase SsuD/methylene tetrahydromethanopterin reductase-like flavin-dependent oxidoreductase (luciferase family)